MKFVSFECVGEEAVMVQRCWEMSPSSQGEYCMEWLSCLHFFFLLSANLKLLELVSPEHFYPRTIPRLSHVCTHSAVAGRRRRRRLLRCGSTRSSLCDLGRLQIHTQRHTHIHFSPTQQRQQRWPSLSSSSQRKKKKMVGVEK